jgi:sporulation protein YlmC with PRC-barrel domain
MTSGPAQIFTALPAGTTVTNFYKQNVYDPSDNKIGDVDDMLIDKEGHVTAMIIGVGGFLGMGEKEHRGAGWQPGENLHGPSGRRSRLLGKGRRTDGRLRVG